MIKKGQSSAQSELHGVKSLGKLTKIESSKNLVKNPSTSTFEKKHMKVEANEVKSKMGKFMEKYKSRMGEVKKTHLGLNFDFNFKNLKGNADIIHQSTGNNLYRTKNNFLLEKGCNVATKKNMTAPTGNYELKKM